jgi:NAD+ synthase (glutamine-hydrolysing)
MACALAAAFALAGCSKTGDGTTTGPTGSTTSTRTLEQAKRLMAAVRCSAQEIDIRPSCQQMLADIGHPYARGEPVYDIAFENVQAGERTSHLFRLANFHNGLVVGTGDLSELALGWSTYGVGDHMSHYNVNASVPKTLIKHLVRWVAASGSVERGDDPVLDEILATQISPELVPGQGADKPGQSSEASVGPYELQDFHLYYVLRYGFAPSKVAFLSHTAWHDRALGDWPDGPEVGRNQYTLAEIKAHLGTFLYRFFKTSQFKRTCVPNSPKVGSGGSLSPRGDWRAPSDSEADVWIEELERNVPDA